MRGQECAVCEECSVGSAPRGHAVLSRAKGVFHCRCLHEEARELHSGHGKQIVCTLCKQQGLTVYFIHRELR